MHWLDNDAIDFYKYKILGKHAEMSKMYFIESDLPQLL